VSNAPRYAPARSAPLLSLYNKIASAELIWPFPLITLGILSISYPLLIGIAVVLALVPWFVRFFIFGRPTRRAFVTGPLLLLVVSVWVSMWATYDLAMSWPLLLTLLGSVSLFFAIVNTTVSPRRIGHGLVVVAGLMALYFIGQYAYFGYQQEWGWPARLGHITGSLLPNIVFFTPQVNAMAAFLESALLLSLVLTWRAHGGERLAWGVAAGVIMYGLFISGSRGSWLGLAAALGLWLLLLIPNRALRLAVGGLGFIGVSFGVYIASRAALSGQQTPWLTATLETAGSRFILYRNSLYLLGDYLFTGIGLGDVFAMVYSRYQLLIPVPFLTYSHNLFLSVGLGLGLLGLIALVWLLISFYIFVFRVERTGLSSWSLSLFRAAWLGVTITLVHSLTDAPQFSNPGWTMPILFAWLGLTIVMGRPVLSRVRQEEIVSKITVAWYRRWTWVALMVITIIVIFSALVFRRPLISAWYANLGAIYQTQADLSPQLSDTARETAAKRAVIYFESALSLNPDQPVANRRYGLMALNHQAFDIAVVYLARAYEQEPKNQATLKALGLAYLWTGQLDSAEKLLRQLDAQDELVEELGNWRWRWQNQNRKNLSVYTAQMLQRLSETK
jgi:putative inorganic carbon (HCO3(-)) transporter